MTARRLGQAFAGIVVSVSCIVLTCNQGKTSPTAHAQIDRTLVLQVVNNPRSAMSVIEGMLMPTKQLPLVTRTHSHSCSGHA